MKDMGKTKSFCFRILILLLFCISGVSASADIDVTINGIYYRLYTESTEAMVRHGNTSSDYSGHIIIPKEVEYDGRRYQVTSIGSAFKECTGLTSITIPNSVTSIGNDAFRKCSNLTKVIIPDIAGWCEHSITYEGIFSNPFFIAGHIYSDENTRVTDLVIPDGITSIGDNVFSSCKDLTSITIPNSVTSIGSNAFESCTVLTSIIIPNSVTTIGDGAFAGCTGLTSITIPNSATSVGGSAFYGCI